MFEIFTAVAHFYDNVQPNRVRNVDEFFKLTILKVCKSRPVAFLFDKTDSNFGKIVFIKT